jgi:hypothetical protein
MALQNHLEINNSYKQKIWGLIFWINKGIDLKDAWTGYMLNSLVIDWAVAVNKERVSNLLYSKLLKIWSNS